MSGPSSGKPPGTKPSRVSKRKSSKESPRRPPALLTDASELAFGKIIGRGSQGCVRIARHTSTGKRYAVKQLPLRGDPRAGLGGGLGGMAVTDEEALRMEAEAEVLKLASDHPNVVRFHGVFRREGTARSPGAHLCIVMSHCEGGDLASLLKSVGGVPLPEEAIMRWVVQLLLGLAHVHSKAILHRDIKPGNVFLTKSLKVVKIGDFGIAKALTERDDLADTQVGTPLYMSPELCQGKPYTYASDVWALGCTVYEMASGGAKAFDAPGWPQLLVKIVRNDYAPLPSHFSRPFLALVSSMLAPDPADRPTAAQLLGHPLVRRHCEALLSEAASAPGGVKPGGVAAAAADAVAAANATNAQNNPNDASNANALASFASHTASRLGVGFAGGSGPVSAIARVRSIRRASSSSSSAAASSSHGGGERSPPRGAAAGAQRLADAERQRAAEARYAARQAMARRDRMAVRDADPRRVAERARADAEAEARVARQRRRETAAAETALLRDRGLLSSPSPSEDTNTNTNTSEADVREAAAFAARPKLERTTTTGGGDARVARDASPDAETQLMEALMAEARRDAEMDAAGDDSNSNVVTRDVSDPGGFANDDDVAPSGWLTRASERLAPADRVASAPGGARIRPRRAVSSSFEWPPPEVDSERQATRDAALERRVRAKLKSYLRASCGDALETSRGDDAGDTNGRASFARPATVGIASSGDAGWAREAFEVHEGPLEASETVEEAGGEADGGSEEAEEVTEEEELYSDDFDSGDYDDDFFGSESAEETREDAKDEAEGGRGA